MPEYLVTGGAGFIGSNAVETLLDHGKTVRVLDNFSSGKRDNIAPFLDRIDLIDGDLRNPDDVRRAVDGVTYVLHFGAVPSVPRSVDDPLTTNEANVTGTLNLLLAARDTGVKRLVFSSSSSVYGDTPTLPKEESMPTSPLSPYAATKLVGEHYCRMFTSLYGFETIVLRYFNVFGPRQDPTSQYAAVVPIFIQRLLQGRPPDVHGDGLQTRDFTFVADTVHANMLACTAPPAAAGHVINVACHQQISILGLFRTIRDLITAAADDPAYATKPSVVQAARSAAAVEPNHTQPRAGDVRDSFADITRARDLLGYEPQHSLKDGLAKTIHHFLEK